MMVVMVVCVSLNVVLRGVSVRCGDVARAVAKRAVGKSAEARGVVKV